MIIKTFLKVITGSAIAIGSISCTEGPNNKFADPLYFDVVGVIDKQIALMDSGDFALEKELSIEEKTEVRQISNVNWQRELEHFKELDINSPVLREQYTVETKKTNSETITVYKPKDSNSNRVEELSISFNSSGKIQSISGKIASENILFSSRKTLRIDFSNETGRPVVNSFVIKNKEHIVFYEPSVNQVTATVITSFSSL